MPVSRSDLMVELHGAHARQLWGYAMRLTGGDHARAEDVVQETLLRAWRSPRLLGSTTGATRAWLFTVARNLVIDEWRSARGRHEVLADELPEPRDLRTDGADEVVEAWLVADALERLSPEHREVIWLCYFRGRTVAEAARHLEIPEGTVKSRTHYALRSLRLALQEMGVTR